MTRSYRLRPDDVIARRLDTADSKGGRIVDASTAGGRAVALLALSKGGADEMDGRRAVARHAMKDAHGCAGEACRHPDHGTHRVVRDELLDALGLAGGERG